MYQNTEKYSDLIHIAQFQFSDCGISTAWSKTIGQLALWVFRNCFMRKLFLLPPTMLFSGKNWTTSVLTTFFTSAETSAQIVKRKHEKKSTLCFLSGTKFWKSFQHHVLAMFHYFREISAETKKVVNTRHVQFLPLNNFAVGRKNRFRMKQLGKHQTKHS